MHFENLLVDVCLSAEPEILELISQRAAWEIPLHALLHTRLTSRGLRVERERHYPNRGETGLDLFILCGGQKYAVEVKVESATLPGQIHGDSLSSRNGRNAGYGVAFSGRPAGDSKRRRQAGVGDDLRKILSFQDVDHRLVLLIGYTAKTRHLMKALSEDTPPSFYGEGRTNFDHGGGNREGSSEGANARLAIGLYNADYY